MRILFVFLVTDSSTYIDTNDHNDHNDHNLQSLNYEDSKNENIDYKTPFS